MDDRNMESGCSHYNDVANDHSKSIIHIDIDCFYAQVEMVRNPELRSVPLGIQQKNIVVTSNYEARKYGVQKCMLVTDALKVCTNLKLVNGEDLHNYRTASNKIFAVLQSWKCPVEKLGMDENFIDVTNLVQEKLKSTTNANVPVTGHTYKEPTIDCPCGCHTRLRIASQIASEMRRKIHEDLSFTTCAGIGHNKLLAKLICPLNKPNNQTTIYPEHGTSFMSTLSSVRTIPSIGTKTTEALISQNIITVSDLQEVSVDALKKHFSSDMAVRLKNLSLGEDNTPVKQTGKPQSISLEDSFKIVSVKSEVEDKFSALLQRLLVLVREDGRIPVSLRVTLRKRDAKRLSSHRESRQSQVSPSIFTFSNGVLTVTEAGQQKLMNIIMRLFNKLMDLSKPFHLTLVGLAFTKFQERMTGRSSIVNYLMNNDISVQSVLNLQSECDTSTTSMDYSAVSPSSSTTTDLSDAEVEPSPKKPKKVTWIAKRRCLSKEEVASPSKLKVGELRLNSKELEKVSELRLSSRDRSLTPRASPAKDNMSDTSDTMKEPDDRNCEDCPSYVDKKVFSELPDDMQKELKSMWKNPSSSEVPRSSPRTMNKAKTNTIMKYFVPHK